MEWMNRYPVLRLFIIIFPRRSPFAEVTVPNSPSISVLIRQQMPQAIMQFPKSRYQLLMGLKITGIRKIANADAKAHVWMRASAKYLLIFI